MQIYKWVSHLLIFVTFFITLPAQSNEIMVNRVMDYNVLVADILNLILEKSGSTDSVKEISEMLPDTRLIEAIKSGKVDLLWAGGSPYMEEQLMPVRIPIFKGLLGHRIFVIKKENQSRFNGITTLGQLKQLTAGQGTQWGDTKVLQDANIPLITTLKYDNLFYMLEGERFDYFPRAVHEAWNEVDMRPDLNLAVEKNLLLIYPFAMYFYVSKNNQALHDKLSKGFEKAIADGSFDKLFFSDERIKNAIEKTNLKSRNVIRIDNPNMHPDTPMNRPEFWLDINNL